DRERMDAERLLEERIRLGRSLIELDPERLAGPMRLDDVGELARRARRVSFEDQRLHRVTNLPDQRGIQRSHAAVPSPGAWQSPAAAPGPSDARSIGSVNIG